MASAWLRLAAERTVHGSDQKIHVVGAAEGDAPPRGAIAAGRPSAVYHYYETVLRYA
jgi:hypothetical protein